ncbi:MAG: tRNA lysidine(34) synthetase TilS [Spirochaetia bacterium]|nr:tRNA lysidine(34) synthetase TilS [Spirochaetia bacterium]
MQSKTFLKDQVIDYFSQIPDARKILLGFSGGPDSMCLMLLLDELKEQLNIEIILAYYNHMLRPQDELSKELSFIRKIVDQYKLPLEIGTDSGRIEELSAEIGEEGAARKARYEFFEQTMKKYGCDHLALAHNLDDTVETLVMRFFKGSGIGGMMGIPDQREYIIRPLSSCPKSVILDYVEQCRTGYSLDTTNLGTDYLRNRVRNLLLPQIREIFPSCTKTLLDFSDKASMTYSFIKEQTAKLVVWQDLGNGIFSTSYSNFMACPDVIKIEAVYSCFDLFAKGENRELPYRFVRTVLDKKSVRGGALLLKGYGFKIRRHGDSLEWYPDKENNKIYNNRGFSVEKSLVSLCKKDDIWIPVDGVQGELFFRSWKNGDYIISGGIRKKLKKIFSEWQVPVEMRSAVPIICDSRGVIAVWGGLYGYRNRVSDLIRLEDKSGEDREVYILKARQD